MAVVLVAGCVLGAGVLQAWAQEAPSQGQQPEPTTTVVRPTFLPPLTTAPPTTGGGQPTTTAPGGQPTSTAPPGGGDAPTTTPPGGGPAPTSTPGGDPASDDGDGGSGAGVVPSSAQAVIDSIPRTAPNDNSALVEGVATLVANGVPLDEAERIAYGRFPIHGASRWVDDWYYPRWTGSTFRHHQGLDMFAAYGTPVAAPADGVAQIGNNALGGLTVRVNEPNGTSWYLAHLSGIAEGLTTGQQVTVGQIVGFVGDSGNARGGSPHLHFGVYTRGAAVPPKPYVDTWVLEGAQRVVDTLAARAAAPQPASVVAAEITRHLSEGAFAGPASGPTGPPRSELLWASAANPAGGSVQLAEAAAAAVNESVDWEQRAAQERALDLAWARAADDARRALAPLTNRFLRQAGERARAASAPVDVGAP